MRSSKTAVFAAMACVLCAVSVTKADSLLPGGSITPGALDPNTLSNLILLADSGVQSSEFPQGSVEVDSRVFRASNGTLTFAYDFDIDPVRLGFFSQPDVGQFFQPNLNSIDLTNFTGTATSIGYLNGQSYFNDPEDFLNPTLATRNAAGSQIEISYEPFSGLFDTATPTIVITTNATNFTTTGALDFNVSASDATDPVVFSPAPPGGTFGVPEISNTGAGSLAIILLGVLALIGESRSRRVQR